MMSTQSLQDRLVAASNRPSGFDYMRLILSTMVLVSHTINVCLGQNETIQVWLSPARPFLAVILPMFFALSGFLVAGSLERCRTLISFAGLRVMRIVPALAVETVLSALLLGVLFTEFPLSTYFSSKQFYTYFLNILGLIHYRLPGVFLENPLPGIVNSQLWTLPFELYCYMAISVLVLVGIAQRARLLLIALLIGNVLLIVSSIGRTGPAITVSGWLLVQCFLYGIAGYLYRRHIPWRAWLGILSGVLTLALLYIPGGDAFVPLPATYFTVYLGLLQPKRIKILFGGDYSYGIFLYGFPIQQAVMAGFGPQAWYFNLGVSFVLTVILATLSWKLVEKPVLDQRHRLTEFENKVIAKPKRSLLNRWFAAPIGLQKV